MIDFRFFEIRHSAWASQFDVDFFLDGAPYHYSVTAATSVTMLARRPECQARESRFSTLSYLMHAGGDGTIPSDQDMFLKYMRMHFQ